MIYPEYIELKDWWASLAIDYPKETIPLLDDEEKWPELGAMLAGIGIFAEANIPAPYTVIEGKKKENFQDWTAWAKAVFIIMTYRQE